MSRSAIPSKRTYLASCTSALLERDVTMRKQKSMTRSSNREIATIVLSNTGCGPCRMMGPRIKYQLNVRTAVTIKTLSRIMRRDMTRERGRVGKERIAPRRNGYSQRKITCAHDLLIDI
jgi:hypothetical protein